MTASKFPVRFTLVLDAIIMVAALVMVTQPPLLLRHLLLIALVGACAFVHAVYALVVGNGDPMDWAAPETGIDYTPDPWEYQRRLMLASDQAMPKSPRLTSGSLLYGALIMEETGEFYRSLRSAILSMPGVLTNSPTLLGLSRNFGEMAGRSHDMALWIRKELVGLTVDYPLDEAHAVALLDDHEDITVVNCGFSLAAGLPGQAGYDEVGLSNLSKINPATGKIDKTPDGKWIKGPKFFKPDLARVLAEHAR